MIGAVNGRVSASGMHFYRDGKITITDSATKYLEADLADYPIRSLTPAPSAVPNDTVTQTSFGLLNMVDSYNERGLETFYIIVYLNGHAEGTHYYFWYIDTDGSWKKEEIPYKKGTLSYQVGNVYYYLHPLVNRDI